MSSSARPPKRNNRCQAKAKSGKPCHAAPTEGGLCYFHANPKKASELGRKGGRSKKRQPTSEVPIISLPALDTLTDEAKLIDYLIEEVHSGRLDPQRAKVIESLLRLRSQMREANPHNPEDAPLPPGANYIEVYEAKWLRDRKRKWAEQFERKHAASLSKGDAENVVAPSSPNIKDIYEAEWVRAQYREWDTEFEQKYADRFPRRETEETRTKPSKS